MIDIVSNPEVLAGVAHRHRRIVSGIEQINARYGVFSEIRGCGLLLGCAVKRRRFCSCSIVRSLASFFGLGPGDLAWSPPQPSRSRWARQVLRCEL